MGKEPKKTVRVDLTREQPKQPRDQKVDEAETGELKLDELEPRVTPRPIGTFF